MSKRNEDEAERPHFRAVPIIDGPVIPSPSIPIAALAGEPSATHVNVNGPSLLRIPDWVEDPLGTYYLYFADHKGDHIKLAYADRLEGPWQLHEPGALHLRDTPFLQSPPPIPDDVDRARLGAPRGVGVPSVLDDITIPHIASPEVVIDEANRMIRLYYHGLDAFISQVTRVAVSKDGLTFVSRSQILASSYLRVFRYEGAWYGLAMPGRLYRSRDGLTDFEEGPTLFEPEMRHAGLWREGDTLRVFWTRVGAAPERILLSTIDLRGDWKQWRESSPVEIHRPTRPWEGAREIPAPSLRSAIDHPVNQLRDPDCFQDRDGRSYLAYAVAGESGLAIARLEMRG